MTNRPSGEKKNCQIFGSFSAVTVMPRGQARKKGEGDGGSAAQKRAHGALPDAVRATKKSSTPVASGTTAEKGAADKDEPTTNRNLALKGKKAMLCAQPRHTLTQCGIHFRSTQMGQCNGFRSRLWQLVRIFTARLVMEK